MDLKAAIPFLIAVAVFAGLALVRMLVVVLIERQAIRAFRECLEAARAAGVEVCFHGAFQLHCELR